MSVPAGDCPNRRALAVAGLPDEVGGWLAAVADEATARLDRVAPGWRDQPGGQAARVAMFGLLLGVLAGRHPHARPWLARAAEAHPGLSTLDAQAGDAGRLALLERLAADPERARSWLARATPVAHAGAVEAALR